MEIRSTGAVYSTAAVSRAWRGLLSEKADALNLQLNLRTQNNGPPTHDFGKGSIVLGTLEIQASPKSARRPPPLNPLPGIPTMSVFVLHLHPCLYYSYIRIYYTYTYVHMSICVFYT